jgi:hypothetical protein
MQRRVREFLDSAMAHDYKVCNVQVLQSVVVDRTAIIEAENGVQEGLV